MQPFFNFILSETVVMLSILKTLNLALAFLLELVMLYAIGYWGFKLKQDTAIRWAAGIGLPLLTAVLWGVLLAPKSVVASPFAVKMTGKFILLLIASGLLYNAGKQQMAIAFIIVVIINFILLFIWRE